MAENCHTIPTLTETETITSGHVTTSFSASTTTADDTTSTGASTECATLAGITTCSTSTFVTTIPGGVNEVQVPFTITVEITSTTTATHFTTSCASRPDGNDDNDSNTDPTPPPTPPPPTPTDDLSTPPPETITSQSTSTDQNGGVSVVWVTVVSTPPPVQATNDGAGGIQQDHSRDESNSNLGPIIGGSVGGFLGLVGVIALIWFIMRRRRRWDDIFDNEDDTILGVGGKDSLRSGSALASGGRHLTLDVDTDPKPYTYGLVGQVHGQTLISPSHSPLMKASQSLQAVPPHISSLIPPAGMGNMAGVSPNMMTHNMMPPQSNWPPASQPYYPPVVTSSNTAHAHRESHVTSPPPPLPYASDDDGVPNRAGSPMSYHEPPRRLHVTNLDSPTGSLFGHEARNVVEEDASPLVDTSTPAQAQAQTQAQPAAAVRVDGKGRRINTTGGGAPLVHLDGGRLQASGSSGAGPSTSVPMPPEYSA